MMIRQRMRDLGLIVRDTRRQNGSHRIVVSSICGTIWSYWVIRSSTPIEVFRRKIHDWSVLCDNIQNGTISIRRAN